APWPVQAGAAAGAAAFALSAYSVAWLYHPHTMVAMWLPGLVLGIVALGRGERGGFAGLVAAAAGLAVSGHPETAANAALLAAGLGLALLLRRPAIGRPAFARRAALAALLAACLTAPIVLPVLEALPASERGTLVRGRAARAIDPPDVRPAVLLPLVQPLAFGSPRDGDWSGPANFNEYCTHYAGAAALAIALAGTFGFRRPGSRSALSAAILLVGLAALLVAVKAQPFHAWFDSLPVLEHAPHARLRLFWVLAVAVAAGLAAPRLAESRAGRWAGVAGLAGAAAVLLLVPPPFGSLHQRLWWGVALAGLVAAALALAVPRLRPAFPAVLLAAVVADLFTLGVRYHALVPPGRQLEPPPALAWLLARERATEEPFRVLAEAAEMPPNLAALHGLWDPRSNDPMTPHDPAWVVGRRLSAGRWHPSRPVYLWPPHDLPALRMLGVRYLLTAHRRRLEPPWEAAFDGVGGRIWWLPEALPLFFVPERVEPVAEPERARALTARNPDFGRLAVHADPGAPAGLGRPAPQEGRVRLRRVRPNGFDLAVESRSGAVVASSVSWAPGWRAAIDGRPGEALAVNWAFLGVRVPPGAHRVELEYAPAGWRWGLALFWGALGACLARWLAVRIRRGAPRPAGSGAP
ncbi:MAG TPA: YfhO family protein, partial [Thermoanaerobaculia bacterium]|nr:YfhO family protein [Thermoanaerobaculia bacterium]